MREWEPDERAPDTERAESGSIREVRGEMRTPFTNLDLSGHHPLAQEKEK